jgi:hypothetical protein
MTEARLRLAALEPPSAMRTLAAALPQLDVTVTATPPPDIRRPRRAQESLLWRYDGLAATPAVAPPSAEAVERLFRIAQPAWPNPPAVYESAADLAAVTLEDLLGLLAHPPAAPSAAPTTVTAGSTAADPAQWTRCVQVWACLGLLHHRPDEPWPGSTRRRVLVDLAWDVEDWITEAAVFALVVAAWVDAGVRTDVAGLMAERLADAAAVVRQRPMTIGWSLGQLALATPGLEPPARRTARELLGVRDRPKRLPRPRRPLAIIYPGRLSRRRDRAAQAELAAVSAPTVEPAAPRPGRLLRWFIRRREPPSPRDPGQRT